MEASIFNKQLRLSVDNRYITCFIRKYIQGIKYVPNKFLCEPNIRHKAEQVTMDLRIT